MWYRFTSIIFSIIAIILGIIALVCGIKAKKSGAGGKAVAGIVMGIIGSLLGVVYTVVLVTAIKAVSPVIERANKGAVVTTGLVSLDAAAIAYSMDKGNGNSQFVLDENNNGEYCVTVQSLVDKGYMTNKSGVEGSVLITIKNGVDTYKVWIKSNDLYINGETLNSLSIDNVTD